MLRRRTATNNGETGPPNAQQPFANEWTTEDDQCIQEHGTSHNHTNSLEGDLEITLSGSAAHTPFSIAATTAATWKPKQSKKAKSPPIVSSAKIVDVTQQPNLGGSPLVSNLLTRATHPQRVIIMRAFMLILSLLVPTTAMAHCGWVGCGMCAALEPSHPVSRRHVRIYGYSRINEYLIRTGRMTVAPPSQVIHQAEIIPTPVPVQERVISTPVYAAKGMLVLADIQKDDVVYDLGCGDARILILARQRHKFLDAVGIEINPKTAAIAKRKVRDAGVDVTVLVGDARKANLSSATVVFMYLYDDLMKELLPRLPSGCRVISFSHPVPGVQNEEKTIVGTDYRLYRYIVP